MASKEQVVDWARDMSRDLREGMAWTDGSMGRGGWWRASDRTQQGRTMACATGALEFLRQHAGTGSEWHARATRAYESHGNNQSMESGAVAVADVLDLWADQIEKGMTRLSTEAGDNLRMVASTDVMEQVRQLNADKAVHPAAPIVLAGAALETALRGAVERLGLAIVGKPGISAYSGALRGAGIITKQDAKDLEQMGGLRNSAAHGEFDAIGLERAGLMEQQVNFFLARLETILDTAPNSRAPRAN